MKETNVIVRIGEHLVEWSTDELATTNNGDFSSI